MHFSNLNCIFCQNFDEILSEFHEHAPNVKNFQFLEKKKDQIFRKIRENFGNVQIIQKIIQHYSVVSLEPRLCCCRALLWASGTVRGPRSAGASRFVLAEVDSKLALEQFFFPKDINLGVLKSIVCAGVRVCMRVCECM